MEKETLDRAAEIAALGLTVESRFVPFSQSRSKDESRATLNWRVTVKRHGRDVLTTDYSAGIAHCPGYKASKAPSAFQPSDYTTHNGKPYAGSTSARRRATPVEALSQYREAIAAAECESGVVMELDFFGRGSDNVFKVKKTRRPDSERTAETPILPDTLDVLYSLHMESDVLNYATFADWAETYGYYSDSRSAESTYRACLEIALAWRAGLGESGMARLSDIFQDY
jgi:hypothetical protein